MELNEIKIEKRSAEKNTIESVTESIFVMTRNKSLKNVPPPQYVPENVLLKSDIESSLKENLNLNYTNGNQISNEEEERSSNFYFGS